MASVSITGEAQTIAAFRALQFKLREAAIKRAAKAGADVAKVAIERNAPTGHGQKYPRIRKSKRGVVIQQRPIREDVIIYKRRRSWEEQGGSMSYLIGPNKDAFYGYFIEHGIAGRERTTVRQFVDRAYKECKDQMRTAIIDVLKKAVAEK